MTNKEISKYVIAKAILKNPIVKRLASGNNSDVYFLKENKKEYTLRLVKNDLVAENKLEIHWSYLKFLESQKIDFVQKPIFFDKKQNILITSYLHGTPITKIGLADTQLKLLIKQINKIHLLSFTEYKKFCQKNKLIYLLPENPRERIDKKGFERWKNIKEYSKDKKLLEWIAKHIVILKSYVKNFNLNNIQPYFDHSDLTGENILLNNDKIYILDWELARFVYKKDRGLAHSFNHFLFFYENRQKIIKYYADIAKLKINRFTKNISKEEQISSILGIIWAMEKYTILKKNKEEDWKNFLELTRARIKDYEKIYKEYEKK